MGEPFLNLFLFKFPPKLSAFLSYLPIPILVIRERFTLFFVYLIMLMTYFTIKWLPPCRRKITAKVLSAYLYFQNCFQKHTLQNYIEFNVFLIYPILTI